MDDFASLQMYKKYNTPMTLISVLQNGRIAGIHVVLVTSVTSSKILPKNLLSLIPCRISFCVSERADSRLAIDKEGAETLRVPGELMVRFQSTLQKCEGTYLPETQMPSVMKRIKRDNLLQVSTLGDMAEQLFKDVAIPETKALPSLSDSELLIRKAIDYCVDAGRVTTTSLQRCFKFGYAQAAKIIDELEELGVIGPSQGANPRKVLLTIEQWEQARKLEGSLSSAIASLQSTGNTDPDAQSSPEINLRDFPKIALKRHNLSISDNRIIISKNTMIKDQPRNIIVRMKGNGIVGVIYKKPKLFSNGFIQFQVKSGAEFTNESPELLTITKEDIPKLLTIEFGAKDAKQMKAFMLQISEDTGVPLTEL